MALPSFHLADFLPYQLSVASNAFSRAVARTYEERFGLKTSEWRTLAVVAGGEQGLLQSEIAARTGMDKMTISRAVAGLRAHGLLARTADSVDRRTPRLTVTDAGWAVYQEVVPAARAIEATVTAALDDAERELLRSALARLRVAAESACDKP